jgi:hypothetical protein
MDRCTSRDLNLLDAFVLAFAGRSRDATQNAATRDRPAANRICCCVEAFCAVDGAAKAAAPGTA